MGLGGTCSRPLSAFNAPRLFFAQKICNFDFIESKEKPALPAGLSEEQLLLLGDPKLKAIEQKRRLHLHDPVTPADPTPNPGIPGLGCWRHGTG